MIGVRYLKGGYVFVPNVYNDRMNSVSFWLTLNEVMLAGVRRTANGYIVNRPMYELAQREVQACMEEPVYSDPTIDERLQALENKMDELIEQMTRLCKRHTALV